MAPPDWRRAYADRCRPDMVEEISAIPQLPHSEVIEGYAWLDTHGTDAERAYLGVIDRYYLLVSVLGRADLLEYKPEGVRWLYERVREVEANPDGHLDLWARFHGKSSVITQAGAIQEVLRDPEITVAIFSHTRPLAKGFLDQIKREFEGNELLKRLYSDVLYQHPKVEAPRWSLDKGLIVRRQGNPKEATVEANGLVDGQPTGMHYRLRIYDDVVTRENVSTPEQVEKTTQAWELSNNLTAKDGRRWMIGTRYSFNDSYQTILDREVVKPRIHPATHDGTLTGEPVLLSQDEWEQIKREQPTQVAAQQLQNPAAGNSAMFQAQWLRAYEIRPRTLNVYILVDPSKGSTQRSDNTAMAVIGVDSALNKYLLDGVRQRLNLKNRCQLLFDLYERWRRQPGVMHVEVGYERYGMQTDDEYIREQQQRHGPQFTLHELAWPRQHGHSKQDRVERLVPDIANGRFFLSSVVYDAVHGLSRWTLSESGQRIEFGPSKGASKLQRMVREQGQPERAAAPIRRVNSEHHVYDLTRAFIEECLYFPFGTHDDLIDACSRIYDMEPTPPSIMEAADAEPPTFVDT